jgi:ubiquinol-cytochrome c reductase cytochrome c1 subunit
VIAIVTKRACAAAVLLAATLSLGTSASAHEGGHEAPQVGRQQWTFSGMSGTFDAAQLQRGFKVYSEVCSRCHGVKRLTFRNLVQPGGPEFPEAGVKSLAADNYKVDAEPNDQGKIVKRPAVLADHIPSPYKNEQEARASQPGGALPPDLSLITKARSIESHAPFYMVPLTMLRDIVSAYQEGGADYVYAYLTGFREPPAGVKAPDGMNYNAAFPAPHFTAMPNPFSDGVVKYDDGTPGTVDNYARDVTAFLAWAGDPGLAERKRLGLLVMSYLLITAILLYFAKRRIWSKVH